jgi:hypothetical protein
MPDDDLLRRFLLITASRNTKDAEGTKDTEAYSRNHSNASRTIAGVTPCRPSYSR